MSLAFWFKIKITIVYKGAAERGYLVTDRNQSGEFYLSTKWSCGDFLLKGKTDEVTTVTLFPLHYLRRFFGCRPKLGDRVAGYLDFSIQFEGRVVEDSSDSTLFPCYTIQGKTFFTKEWTNEEVVEPNDQIIIPAGRVSLQ